MCYRYRAVRVVSEVKPEEVSGISIEGDLIVFAEAGHKGAKIFLLFAEYERVVDVYEDVGGLNRGDAIKEAVVRGHEESFGKESSLVVEVEETSGVGQVIEGVGYSEFLVGIQAA